MFYANRPKNIFLTCTLWKILIISIFIHLSQGTNKIPLRFHKMEIEPRRRTRRSNPDAACDTTPTSATKNKLLEKLLNEASEFASKKPSKPSSTESGTLFAFLILFSLKFQEFSHLLKKNKVKNLQWLQRRRLNRPKIAFLQLQLLLPRPRNVDAQAKAHPAPRNQRRQQPHSVQLKTTWASPHLNQWAKRAATTSGQKPPLPALLSLTQSSATCQKNQIQTWRRKDLAKRGKYWLS